MQNKMISTSRISVLMMAAFCKQVSIKFLEGMGLTWVCFPFFFGQTSSILSSLFSLLWFAGVFGDHLLYAVCISSSWLQVLFFAFSIRCRKVVFQL
jgi:hypothetical protein